MGVQFINFKGVRFLSDFFNWNYHSELFVSVRFILHSWERPYMSNLLISKLLILRASDFWLSNYL